MPKKISEYKIHAMARAEVRKNPYKPKYDHPDMVSAYGEYGLSNHEVGRSKIGESNHYEAAYMKAKKALSTGAVSKPKPIFKRKGAVSKRKPKIPQPLSFKHLYPTKKSGQDSAHLGQQGCPGGHAGYGR